jgi:hypothetical protein
VYGVFISSSVADQARELFGRSGLAPPDLARIWTLADRDQDARLSRVEFAIAMHLINAALQSVPLPARLGPKLLASLGIAAAAAAAPKPAAAATAQPAAVKPVKPKPQANYDIDLTSVGDPTASSVSIHPLAVPLSHSPTDRYTTTVGTCTSASAVEWRFGAIQPGRRAERLVRLWRRLWLIRCCKISQFSLETRCIYIIVFVG